MKNYFLLLIFISTLAYSQKNAPAISIEKFSDGIKHWNFTHAKREIWARYYEISSKVEPFMANHDGKKVYLLSDVAPERHVGSTGTDTGAKRY